MSKLFPSQTKQCDVFHYLYIHVSTQNILNALCGQLNPHSVELRPDDLETTIFLAELSFVLASDWITVARCLRIKESIISNLKKAYNYDARDFYQQAEASFKMMLDCNWLRGNTTATLQCLLNALLEVGIVPGIRKLSEQAAGAIPFHQLSSNVKCDIAVAVASQWRFVGRLLGLTESTISEAAMKGGTECDPYAQLIEQSYSMLDLWKKKCGNEATSCRLKYAVRALHEHSGRQFWDAFDLLHSF